VYFSFHYEGDIWRAANIRKSGVVDATARAGWADASLWEEAKKKGHAEIRRLIDKGLTGTSVTAVLIGAETADRPWVNYEIEKSIERGNGLLGIRVHRIRDQNRHMSKRGAVPDLLRGSSYRVYDWNRSSLGRWVEHAALDAGKDCLAHKRSPCFACRWLWWW
jgi:hypothetical protein